MKENWILTEGRKADNNKDRGEKFDSIVSDNHFARQMVRTINEQRKQSGYNPVRESGGKFNRTINLPMRDTPRGVPDDEYKEYTEVEDALILGDMMRYFQIT